ncbi:HAMP domain-containing histidine kinase [Agromyces endophyticus]|uniref:sensor histidine kinase n=1 Tax=Agromyces sp. H17E-10 TaxID=2932244 RepID=UPI001FD138B8|nr:HAMP domain-containing sensor histidine kinase [Agromyces sp. H17E-10]UOQ87980.1 HAMP domain-containing histidine kinase [Agromyces sp. H17E-10]
MKPDMLPALAVAAVVATAIGLAGALVVLAVARRRPALAAALGPLAVVAALAGGVAVSVQTMLLPDAAVSAVLWLLVAAVPAALAVGLVSAVRTHRLGEERAAAVAARERDAAAEARRREGIAWISHDLRTPLAAVRALAEAGEDGVTAPGDALRGILGENARMSAMVDDLLAYSRLHAPGLGIDRSPTDVGDVVSGVIASTAPLAEAASVALTGDVGGDLVIAADAGRLGRAIENLVVNAIRHTSAGGEVRVRAVRAGEVVEVSVHDRCGGIAEADLDRVFEPGWRATEARSPGRPDGGAARGGGTGMGLSIVQRVAELHGGTVTVANEGAGCRFVVRIPVEPPTTA